MATILLIEDDSFVRNATARLLTGQGHTVWKAADGVDGVELYRTLPRYPDLVITDTIMPRRTGFEVIRQIRELRPGQPMLRISAWPEPNPPDIGETVPVLCKPFEADVLDWMVGLLLRHR